jgi:hypothetical protein
LTQNVTLKFRKRHVHIGVVMLKWKVLVEEGRKTVVTRDRSDYDKSACPGL